MVSIVTRKNSFAVVYMTTVNGVRKQKWESYHTLPEAARRKGSWNYSTICGNQRRSEER